VRSLHLQAGGPGHERSEVDLPGEAVRRVAHGRVPLAVVHVPVGGDGLLGLLRHGGDEPDGERLIAQVDRPNPLVLGDVPHRVPDGGEVLCPPVRGAGGGAGLQPRVPLLTPARGFVVAVARPADQHLDAADRRPGGLDQLGVALGDPTLQGLLEVGAGRGELALFHEVLAEVLEGEVDEFRVRAAGGVQGGTVERVRGVQIAGVAVCIAEVEFSGDDRPAVARGDGPVDRGRGDIAAVDEVLGRSERTGREVGVDPLQGVDVLLGRRCGGDVDDDVGRFSSQVSVWWSL
jgi:hypothetical protein